MSLKDKLKKGQAFLGVDDNKYYFLGFDYDDQIFFTTLDLWSDKEQGYMTKNNIFIKLFLTNHTLYAIITSTKRTRDKKLY